MGSGPWGSENPSYAAIPSQLIEGGAVLAAVVLLLLLPFLLRLRLRGWGWLVRPGLAPKHEWRFLTGRGRYVTALTLWALVRLFVASTWRDARVLGPLVAEQVLLIALAAAVLVGPPGVRIIRTLPGAVKSRRASRHAARAERAAMAAEQAQSQVDSDANPVEPAAPAAEPEAAAEQPAIS
jgi:hypothetical protein